MAMQVENVKIAARLPLAFGTLPLLPAISVRPGSAGFEVLVRYVTRANERYQLRARLHTAIVELLRHNSVPAPAPQLASSAKTA